MMGRPGYGLYFSDEVDRVRATFWWWGGPCFDHTVYDGAACIWATLFIICQPEFRPQFFWWGGPKLGHNLWWSGPGCEPRCLQWGDQGLSLISCDMTARVRTTIFFDGMTWSLGHILVMGRPGFGSYCLWWNGLDLVTLFMTWHAEFGPQFFMM